MPGITAEGRALLFGRPEADWWMVQMADEHDVTLMESEYAHLSQCLGTDQFCIMAYPVRDWFSDLSPWDAPPVFGKTPFGHGAQASLEELVGTVLPAMEKNWGHDKQYVLCGYSLAGLFALYAACHSEAFRGYAAVSPSVWFPGWIAYAREHMTGSKPVYLSLGDKEPRTKNPVMSQVGDAIEAQYRLLKERGCACTLEWNVGNHFVDADIRCAKGLAWILHTLQAGFLPGQPFLNGEHGA